jgi:RNA polymerase sigma factor (sigma-70 family)
MLSQIDARDSIILGHYGLPFAVLKSLSRRFPSIRYLDEDDAIQTGMLALIRAADSYDGSKGVTFAHYAWVIIRRAMLLAASRTNMIRVPRLCPNRLTRMDFLGAVAETSETKNSEGFDLEKWLPKVQALANELAGEDRELCCQAFGLFGYSRMKLSNIARRSGCSRQNISLRLKRIVAWMRERMVDCLAAHQGSQVKGTAYIRLRPRRKTRSNQVIPSVGHDPSNSPIKLEHVPFQAGRGASESHVEIAI